MTQNDEWAKKWTRAIGQEVARRRRGLRISAAELAERCSDAGFTVARNTIANLENGRKAHISVQEVAVLAYGLECPPVELLYPLTLTEFEVLPNIDRHPHEGLKWFSGVPSEVLGRFEMNDKIFKAPKVGRESILELWHQAQNHLLSLQERYMTTKLMLDARLEIADASSTEALTELRLELEEIDEQIEQTLAIYSDRLTDRGVPEPTFMTQIRERRSERWRR